MKKIKIVSHMSITVRKISVITSCGFSRYNGSYKELKKRKSLLRRSPFKGQVKLMESVIHNIGNTITNLTLGLKVIEENQSLDSFD